MLSIAGQTALPNWLKFMGGLGFKKLNFFKIILLNLNFFFKHLFLTGNTGPFS